MHAAGAVVLERRPGARVRATPAGDGPFRAHVIHKWSIHQTVWAVLRDPAPPPGDLLKLRGVDVFHLRVAVCCLCAEPDAALVRQLRLPLPPRMLLLLLLLLLLVLLLRR